MQLRSSARKVKIDHWSHVHEKAHKTTNNEKGGISKRGLEYLYCIVIGGRGFIKKLFNENRIKDTFLFIFVNILGTSDNFDKLNGTNDTRKPSQPEPKECVQ